MKRSHILAISLLLLIPLADVVVLILLASFVFDWKLMIAVAVLTGLIGMLLVRAEGRHTVRRLERKLSSGQIPTDELLDGAFLIAAGAALLTPGVVTDFFGLLLAVPVTRYPIRAGIKRFVVTPYLDKKTGGFMSGQVWTDGFPREDTYTVDSSSYRYDDNES